MSGLILEYKAYSTNRTINITHGFTSASKTPAPTGDSRCSSHHLIQQPSDHPSYRRAVEDGVGIVDTRAGVFKPLLDQLASACPASCEHLADGFGDNTTSCFVRFAKNYEEDF